MKKLIVLATSLLLAALGLVGVSGSAAQAKDCPYTGCFDTRTQIFGKSVWPPGSRPRMKVKVTTNGNAVPRGRIVMRVKKNDGSYWRQSSARYFGEPRFVRFPRVDGPGRYTLTAIFKAGDDRPFRSSRDSKSIRVER